MGEHIAKLPQSIINMQMKVSHQGDSIRRKPIASDLTSFQIFWATIPIYNTALIVAKLSILLQYLRIFTTKSMRIACYCLIAFLCTYGTWTILSAWLNCIPVAKFWDETVQGHCLSKKGLWFSNSAIHIFTDIMMIIYPMPALKSLNLPKRQKIAVMGIFSLGGLYVLPPLVYIYRRIKIESILTTIPPAS